MRCGRYFYTSDVGCPNSATVDIYMDYIQCAFNAKLQDIWPSYDELL